MKMFRNLTYTFIILIQLKSLLYSQQNISFNQQLKTIDKIDNDSLALLSLQSLSNKNIPDTKSQLELNYRIIEKANALRKFNKAIALGNESIVIAHNNHQDSLEAVLNKLLGASYYFMDRRKASVPYFEKALVIASKNNYWELEAICYNNIGGALTDISEFNKAEPYLLKSIQIMNDNGKGNSHIALRTRRVLARLYSESGKPEKAVPLYLELIQKSKLLKDTALLCDNLLYYSTILAARGKFDEAIKMSGEAVDFLRKRKNLNELEFAIEMHGGNFMLAGKFKEAYNLSVESKLLLRNAFAKNLEKEISEVEVKYKTAQIKQEKEIAELNTKKQKQIYLFSILGLFILSVSGIYVWNQRKKAKHLTELGEIEKIRFKDIINAEEKERSRIAQELHDGLGQMLSTARLNVAGLEDVVTNEDKPDVERSLKIIDDACIEVRSISHNLMPSALIRLGLIPAIKEVVNNINASKGVKIDFISNIDSSLGRSIDITIYRVVQEILNNMIKHAKATLINVNIEKNGDNLKIQMKDNGIGFNIDELKESKGIGWKNILSRVSMLDGTVELKSESQKGTIVFINLKLKNG